MFFYAWGAPKFVFILLASTYVDFYLVRKLDKQENTKLRKRYLAASILLNLGLLVYFKYAGFFVENISTALAQLGLMEIRHLNIILPIGISFYTFQTLTYSIDVYRKQVRPLEKVSDYLLYIFLFPQMIAGPIVRFSSIAAELKSRAVNSENLFHGLNRFALGLAKKVLLANPCGAIADRYMSGDLSQLNSGEAWIGIIAYTFQIYFDFSGYSDMAIGLGRIFGFQFPENFNQPYISKSITEFWRRWHITLGAWMRDYLYIPLGGNKGTARRTYLNLWIVFLASGLWHGASWNFVLWGAFHGLLLVIERAFRGRTITSKLPSAFQIGLTFFLAMMAWVVFRIEDFSKAQVFYQKLFSFSFNGPLNLGNFEIFSLVLATIITFGPWQRLRLRFPKINSSLSVSLLSLRTLALLWLSLMWLISSDFNPFIYFRF